MSGLKYTRLASIVCWLLCAAGALSAQGVFPVLITGVMLPPRSLDLSVYVTQRPGDLVFTATLADPVEPYRDVRLKLYIESNNQTIYVTDPNAAVPVTRIYKDQPQVFDGFALQPYLQTSALTGYSGEGMGSVIIPEGFDRILVEVIDVQRNVPISRKAAVSGNFVLNEPPFTALPTCGSLIPLPAFQNQLFNWTPRHIGSLNPPGIVGYNFKLVELLPGVGDPNDGFDNNLTIYETSTMMPSLIYSVGQPQLEANKMYAWRVQAHSATSPGLYFRNNGYSNVCTFSYTTDPIGGGGGLGGNEELREPPTGCETFDTDFGPIATNDIVPALLTDGDVVKLGWFSLELTSVYSTGQGYSGEGLIRIPFLAAKIKVTFSNLKAKEGNIEKRVYEVASVRAVVDNAYAYDPSILNAGNLSSVFNAQYVTGLESFFATGGGQNRKLSAFDPQSPQAISLPMAIDREADGGQQPLIVVTGIRFTPRNAFLTCVSFVRGAGNSLMRYAAFEVPCAPYGVKTNSTLALLDGANTQINQAFTLKIDGGGMGVSCLGFKDYDLDAEVLINPEVIAKASDNSTLKVGFSENTSDPATYLGGINDFASFKAPQLPGFVFSMNNGKLDLRTGEKLNLQHLDSIFQNVADNSWRGLYLDDVSVKLPPEYDFTGNHQGITLDKGFLSVQEGGLNGIFRKTGIVSLANGKLGTWRYSVDTMALTVVGSQTGSTTLSGQIRVPLLDEPFAYRSQLDINSSETQMLVMPQPGQRAMSMWGGQLYVNDSTIITAKLREVNGARQFFPYAEIFGRFSAAFDAAKFEQYLSGNKALAIAQIKQLLDVPTVDFQVSQARFGGLKADPYGLPDERYTMTGAGVDSVTIGGKNFLVGELSLLYHPEAPGQTEELGLKIIALAHSSMVQLVLWGKANTDGGFQFDRIEVETDNITCNCHSLLYDRSGDDTRMGQLQMEKYYEENYAAPYRAGHRSKRGGVKNIDAGDEAPEAAYKAAVMARLEASKVGGFIVDDQTLVLPWGDKLKISGNGSSYSGTVAIGRTASNFTFEGVNGLNTNPNVAYSLPIDLTSKLAAMKITKNLAWPADDHVKFLLTKFDITPNQMSGPVTARTIAAGVIVTAEFTLLVKMVNGSTVSYMQFVTSTAGKVSATGVDLQNFFLYLANDVTLPGFTGSASLKLKKSDVSTPGTGTYAKIDCSGFQGFNVQAELTLPNSKVKKPDGSVFTIGATITGSNLNKFIASVNVSNFAFAVPGVEQLVFEGDNNKSFTIYLDYDESANAEGCDKPASFRGLFLKEVKARLEGFTMNTDNRDLFFSCTNFTIDPANGLSGRVAINNLINAQSNSSLGGWGYTLDQIAFEFSNSALTSSSGAPSGLSLSGTVKMPLIPGNTTLRYTGTVSYDNTTRRPIGDLTIDVSAFSKSFAPEGFPGFAFQFQQGSVIGLRYQPGAPPAGQNNQGSFVPYAKLSGNASVTMSTPFEMSFDLFTFQNLTINDPDNPASDLPPGQATAGPVKRTKMGTWGTRASGSTPPPAPEGSQPSSARSGLQGFPITISGVSFQTVDSKPALGVTFGVNLMKNSNSGGSGGSGGTSGLSGSTTLAFPLKLDNGWIKPDGAPILKDVTIEGKFGPVGIRGALKTISGDAKWGNGFKAKLDVDVKSLAIQALAQFGTTKYNNSGTDFRYFFLDLEATSEAGLPLILVPVKVTLHGIGGGFYYNMQVQVPTAERTLTQRPEPGNYMEPGVSLSGFTYEPKNNSYGGNFKVIASVVQAQTLTFDAGLGMTIQINSTGTLSFAQLTVNGSVQLMPQTVATRRETALAQGTANIVMDFNTKQLAGAFTFTMNYPLGTPPDLFGIQATAQAALMINFNDGKWYLKCGRPIAGQYMRADFTLFKRSFGQIEAYLQTGYDLDPAPDIASLVPNWSSGGSATSRGTPTMLQNGASAVMGLKCTIPKQSYTFLAFYASLEAGLGFDLSMAKETALCNGKPKGINGWYLNGKAYAYINGSLGMKYKIGVLKGNVNILSVNMSSTITAQLANPAQFRANLKGSFSVLGGLIKGNINFLMLKRHDSDCLDALPSDSNPVAGLKLVAETYPDAQAPPSDKFQVYALPKMVLNVPLAKTLEFEDINDAGESTWKRFKPTLVEFSLKQNGTAVPGSSTFELYSVTFKPTGLLKPSTPYTLTYNIKWQEVNADGSFKAEVPDGTESKTLTFTTDKMPDKIVAEALDYHAPGRNQRFWHKNYAEPRIAFRAGDWTSLFPASKSIPINGVNTTINFDYFIRLTEYTNGTEGVTTDVPLSEFPGLKNFEIPTRSYTTIANKFTVPYVSVQSTQGLNVGFAGLNNLDLKKGSLYKLLIIRKPVVPVTQTSETQQTTTVDTSYTLNIPVQSLGTAADGPLASEFKILYEYWFGVSNFNSLHEKLQQSVKKWQPSSLGHPSDIGHPKDQLLANITLNTSYNWKDDYIAFEPVNGEGFDSYDLDRIRLNMSGPTYGSPWPLEAIYYTYNMRSLLASANNASNTTVNLAAAFGGGSIGTIYDYLNTVLEKYPAVPDWQYHFNLLNNDYTTLTDAEITAKRTSPSYSGKSVKEGVIGDVFASNVNFSLVYQDVRSRIVMFQCRYMDWVSERVKAENAQLYLGSSGEGFRKFGVQGAVRDADIDNYGSNYRGAITLNFPQVNLWQNMRQKASGGYPQLVITIPARPKNGTGPGAPAGSGNQPASEPAFPVGVYSNYITSCWSTYDKVPSIMNITRDNKTRLYWDGVSREMDLYNASNTRYIVYNQGFPRLAQGSTDMRNVFSIPNVNSNDFLPDASGYKAYVRVPGETDKIYTPSPNSGGPMSENATTENVFNRAKLLRLVRDINGNQQLLTLSEIGTAPMPGETNVFTFLSMEILDSQNRPIFHRGEDGVRTIFNYAADGYTRVTPAFSNPAGLLELTPGSVYTVWLYGKYNNQNWTKIVNLNTNIWDSPNGLSVFPPFDNIMPYTWATLKGDIAVYQGNALLTNNADLVPATGQPTHYGEVLLGLTVDRAFKITNKGNLALLLTGTPRIQISGANAADFTVVEQPATMIGISASLNFTIRCKPKAPGERTALITIASDDPAKPQFKFPVKVVGVGPEINVTYAPGDDNFGTVAPNGIGGRSFRIDNITGTRVLNLTGNKVSIVGSTEFEVSQPSSTVNFGQSGTSNFYVQFKPTSLGAKQAVISIQSDDYDENPYLIQIRGNCEGALVGVTGNGNPIANGDITPDATDLTDFGSLEQNDTRAMNFMLTNAGNLPLYRAGDIQLSGATDQFSISAQPMLEVGINGGTSAFTINYNPKALGTHTATVKIPMATGGDYTFIVKGKCEALQYEVQGKNNLVITSNEAANLSKGTDLGEVVMSVVNYSMLEGPKSQSFTIKNTGQFPLRNISFTRNGSSSIQAPESIPDIPVGGSGSFTVSCAVQPSSLSSSQVGSNLITITMGLAGNTFVLNSKCAINFKGFLICAPGNQSSNCLADNDVPSVPKKTDFGSLTSGSKSTVFEITNVGNIALTLTGTPLVTLSGPNAGNFEVTQQPGLSNLAVGGKTTFTVKFTATAPGMFTATAKIRAAGLADYSLNLRGFGPVPVMEVKGNSLAVPDADNGTETLIGNGTNFNIVPSGSKTQSFTIKNTGTVTLSIGAPTITGANAADYSVSAPLSKTSLAQNEEATFAIKFTAGGGGSRTATVSIASNDPMAGNYTFPVKGTKEGPVIKVYINGVELQSGAAAQTANGTDFGVMPIDVQMTRVITVKNTGSAALTFQNEPLAFIQHGLRATIPSGLVVNPGQSVDIPVVNSLTSPDAYSYLELYLRTDDPVTPIFVVNFKGEPIKVKVTAQFAANISAPEANTISFDNQALNTSVTKSLRIWCRELTGLYPGSVPNYLLSQSGVPEGFSASINSTYASTQTEYPIYLNVTFTPTVAKSYNNTFNIIVNGNQTVPITLTGKGLPIKVTGSDATSASATPKTSLTFPAQNLNQSATQTLKVWNTRPAGSPSLTVSSAGIPPGYTASFSPSNVIAPGSYATLSVVFTPTGVGSFNGTLNLGYTDDGNNMQQAITLSGSGKQDPGKVFVGGEKLSETTGSGAYETTSFNFYTKPATSTTVKTVKIWNNGPVGCKDITLTLPTNPQNYTLSLSPSNVIAQGQYATLTITFRPLDEWGATITYNIDVAGTSTNIIKQISLAGQGQCENLALNKSARASSKLSGFLPASLVDGNESTMMKTTKNNGEWVEIDLGAVCDIQGIIVAPCYENCEDISQYYAMVGNTPFPTSVNVSDALQVASWKSTEQPSYSYRLPCPAGTMGRYVRLQRSGYGSIHLSEIRVLKRVY